MSIMPIPVHQKVTPAFIGSAIERYLRNGSCKEVKVFTEKSVPKDIPRYTGVTNVPYLVLPLEGYITTIGSDIHGPPLWADVGIALFFQSDTWVGCDTEHSNSFLRITFDVDHILFGIQRGCRRTDVDDALRLLCFISPWLATALAQLVIKRFDDILEYTPSHRWECHAINLLLYDLADQLRVDTTGKEGKGYRTWLLIRQYVNEHSCMPLTRESVARNCGITPGHLSKLFSKYGKTEFIRCLHKVRLEKACLLLRKTNQTIAEIAYQTGYTSENYFIRIFKKTYSMTPGTYRIS